MRVRAKTREASAAHRPTHGTLDDRALLARIATGDRVAFDAFYRRHYVRLLRFVTRVTREHDIVDEVINDTMLAVWRGAQGFRNEAQPTTWLLGIGWRTTLQRLRAKDRKYATVPIDDIVLADPSCPEHLATDRQFGRHLRACLAAISPAHRAVVELTYFHGYSSREIAQILGCPEGTVRTRMLHARHKLRTLLIKRLGAEAETDM